MSMQESKDSAPTIGFESKKTYFDKPITYSFQEQVNVLKSKYSLQLTNISKADQTAINDILSKFDNTMSIKDSAFIDSKKIIINKCMIVVDILGFRKIGDVTKPIWELKKAEICMQQVILTKDNVMTIVIDSGMSRDYYHFKMNFFLKPIIYAFQDPVKLKRCPFSMQVLEISSEDKTIINNLLSRVDNLLKIDDAPFINDKEFDENSYTSDKKYLLTVIFKGFKRYDNTISPIWKIKTVQDFY